MAKSPIAVQKLYVADIAQNAPHIAKEWGIGLELDEFTAAQNTAPPELDHWLEVMRGKMTFAHRYIFHAPYGELTPAALDPLIAQICRKRLEDAWQIAYRCGIKAMVVHSGYIPGIYYPQWYTQQAAAFWHDFLADKPDDCLILVENVMDDDPYPLVQSIKLTDDKRCRICLDIGHAAVKAGDVTAFAKEVLPYLAHVHLHDNDGKKDMHLPIGGGILPIEDILAVTCKADPTYTLETAEPLSALKWLKDKGYIL